MSELTAEIRLDCIVVFYATAVGQPEPAAQHGRIATGTSGLRLPVSMTNGGAPAEILYAGSAPGMSNGVVQINVRVPVTLTPRAAVPTILDIGGCEPGGGHNRRGVTASSMDFPFTIK